MHAEIGDRTGSTQVFLRLQLARAGALSQFLHLVGDDRQGFRFGAAQQRCYQPILDCHRDADVGMPVLEHAALGPRGIGVGHALQRDPKCFDDEIVDRELPERLAILVLRRGVVDLLARGQETADVAIDREVEVRDGKAGLREPLGDDPSHAVVRHELVGAFWIERADLLVGHATNGGRRHACGRRRRFGHRRHRRSGRCRRQNALGGFCRFDVGRDDAPMRARALDAGEVDAGLFGQPPRQRRGNDPACIGGLDLLSRRLRRRFLRHG